MYSPRFEPMTVGGILDQTFRLYRANFLRYVTIVALIQVPLGLLTLAFQTTWVNNLAAGRGADSAFEAAKVLGFLLGFGLTFLVAIIAQQFVNAALVKSISESYLGGDVSVLGAYRFLAPKAGWLILAALIIAFGTGIGLMLCIVPGIFFSLYFVLTTQGIVTEDLNVIDGMKRSASLVSGNLGKVFLVLLVVFLLNVALGAIDMGIMAVVGRLVDVQKHYLAIQLMSQGLPLLQQVLMAPIHAAATILIYYDLRIRKEGFDLEMLARSFRPGGAAADGAAR